MKGSELDRVAVDLADVEVFADFWHFGSGDVIRGAPDAFGGFMLKSLGCE